MVAASDKRLMLVREFEQPATLSVHHPLAELYQGVDWVLVEGFATATCSRSRSGVPGARATGPCATRKMTLVAGPPMRPRACRCPRNCLC